MASGRFRARLSLMSYPKFTIVTPVGSPPDRREENIMSWKKPKVVAVSLALEINSYASAEIG